MQIVHMHITTQACVIRYQKQEIKHIKQSKHHHAYPYGHSVNMKRK